MTKVLIIEDDKEICEILTFYLKQDPAYQVEIVFSAEKALEMLGNQTFDLILLDIMLPSMDGISFCAHVREKIYCPIIFISCLNDDESIIKALNMGGDDYLVKPFRGPVLMARIEANLRRFARNKRDEILTVKDLSLNSKTHMLYKNDQPIVLSPTEYEILYYLIQHKGEFVSFEVLYDAIWQRPSLGDLRTLFVHMRNLRKKIEDDANNPYYIRTHLREGYIFTEA